MEWKKILKANYMQLSLVFVAFFLMVEVSYISVSDIVQKHLNERAADALRVAETNTELGLKESILTLTALAESLRDALERGVSEGRARSLLNLASTWLHSDDDGRVLTFYGILLGASGEYPISGSGYVPDDIPRKLAWFMERERGGGHASARDRIRYSAPYTDAATGRMLVTAACGIYSRSGEFLGVIATDIDTIRLSSYFSRFRPLEGGYGILLDEHMILVGHPKRELLGFPLLNIASFQDESLRGRLRTDGQFSSVRMKNVNGDSVIVSLRKMFNGWYIGTVIPFDVYYRDVYREATILSVIGFILAFCLSYILLRISAAKMQSDEENQSKSTVVATISHEIRTPLNAIIGLSEMELSKDLPASTRNNLEKILNSGSNLLAIINDILDISKITAGRLELTPADFDVPNLINDVVQLNLVRIGSKNIVFGLQVDETTPRKLRGDELRVKQVLNNLLSNAFKYTLEGSVSLNIRCRRDGDFAVLQFIVQDTGIGIKKEHLGQLFKEYSQLDSRPDRNIEGTGLGLSIARNLVELMGGTIAVSSKYGEGSRFTVVLRLQTADATPIDPETVNRLRNLQFLEGRSRRNRRLVIAHALRGKVLVVDDVTTNLDVAKGLMTPYGLTVDCVLSGPKAIELVQAIPDDAPDSEKYDVIFMDHMMPEMDGVETVRVIRSLGTEYARTVPIVALTANAIIGSSEMFLQNGFNDFVPKPIDLLRLDAVLNKWVRSDAPGPALPQAAEDGILDGIRAEGLDIEGGIRHYAGGKAYLSIIRSYAHHTPELLETLRVEVRRLETLSAPSEEDLRKYAVAVHGLKGASYGVKAGAVGEAAEALERAAKAGDWETVRTGNGALLEEAEALLVRMDGILKAAAGHASGSAPHGAGKKRERRAAPDPALLERLLSAARRFKTSEMEELMEELDSCDYESGADIVAWLRDQIENIEYEAVAERLKALLSGR
ncbi:MAG: response regulator [Synergistaceae bacterium]|jgi:signal transduction histidine kinase/CheY-like chemotaxis protein|nr:response regulator [Synergistaceae bacterium]